jgi:glycosyltransferase involved in cell wall biosynthesis
VPSCWQEPFGRVVIEAYAHGLPVIAAQRGGLPEIVDDGETGWTYDPDSDAMLKRHLEKVCTSPEQLRKMRPAVRERAKTFGVDRHAQAYEHVYNRAIADVSSMQPTESEC